MFTLSDESDTGVWPDVSRRVEDAPAAASFAANDLLAESAVDGRRVDVMGISTSGESISLAVDAQYVSEASELLDAAGIKLTAGRRYVSERRGPRQTVFIPTSSLPRAQEVLEGGDFDFRPGRLSG